MIALDDSGYAQERDPAARTARLPSMALRAARTALDAGRPVLVQVPRRGYVPALACARCRTIARCRHCTGPLSLPGRDAQGRSVGGVAATNPRCAARDAAPRPCAPSSSAPAAPPRSWAGRFPARRSSRPAAKRWWPRCRPRPAVVVATPGAEPAAPGGYGAALLLDGWALLGRQDLRAAEDTLRRWMAAAALVRTRGDGGASRWSPNRRSPPCRR